MTVSYRQLNALPPPSSIDEFTDWCDERYNALEKRLADLLGVDLTESTEDGDGHSARRLRATYRSAAARKASNVKGNWFRRRKQNPAFVNRMMRGIVRVRARYMRFPNVPDLDDLTSRYRSLLAHPKLAAAQPELRAHAFADASMLFLERFHTHGTDEDLENAVNAAERAMAESTVVVELRDVCASVLGSALRARFERWGRREDIDRAVECHEQTLLHAMPGSPRTPTDKSNLANAFWSRYLHFGSRCDLDRAAELHREAIDTLDIGSPGRAAALNNIALTLRDMYEFTGDLTFLEEAVAAAVGAVDDPHLEPDDRAPAANSMLSMLFARYHHTRDRRDLDLIVEIATTLLEMTAGRDRATCLQHLAKALAERHLATGDLGDLQRAVATQEEAVQITPHDHPDRPAVLDNWASALWYRWQATGDAEDLRQARNIREALADATSADQPGRIKFLNNLGLTLIATSTGDPDPQATGRITNVFREACQTGLVSSPGEVLNAAGTWGNWAAERTSWAEAAAAYEFGMTAIANLCQAQVLRRHKELWLVTAGRFAAEAAFAHARTGRSDLAVQSLERGRSVLLSEALERDRADLATLERLGHVALSGRFGQAVEMARRAGLPPSM